MNLDPVASRLANTGVAFGVQGKFLDNIAQKMMLGSRHRDGECDGGDECEQAGYKGRASDALEYYGGERAFIWIIHGS